MKMTLAFVPPGGGETDYSLDFDLPSIPAAGDCIFIRRTGEEGTCSFRVRRTQWILDSLAPDTGRATEIIIECEFADSGFAGPSHKRSVDMYEKRGKGRINLDDSVY